MKIVLFAAGAMAVTTVAFADTDTFDKSPMGKPPARWTCGVTGQGSPVWKVEADASAPSKPQVLKQSGNGDYPWCVRNDVSLKDGFVEVKFKPVSGSEDQAGGLVWRWKDGDNYYVARANALEDNVTIYHTINGSRRQFKSADMKVAGNQWHTLRVEFDGNRFKVLFDGKVAIEATDDTLKDAGAVGVWTKADSVTAFDDFSHGKQGGNP
ncbi:family 16 glycoside hydrolase [Hyphomicrobium sp. 2TAF46]|uniref:family 16 glycoside hydrolase n=1 Tax=Hyphomicrobium sp. 2TAF46 TaxID=3233019 RepID=UPI003F911437